MDIDGSDGANGGPSIDDLLRLMRVQREPATALADGGSNTLDNIRPMHPAEHVNAGDFARWARRPGIARAFGGTVEAFPILELGSLILGALSGRIRTNSVDNMLHDMLGEPSMEDRRKQFEDEQRRINPNWKPGDPIVLEI